MQVTIVGSACVDLAVRTQTLPRAGETVVGGEFSRLPGGKGANQAVATARLGAPVQFEGCVGADEHGQLLRDALAIEGVDLGRLRTVDTPTAVSVLQIDVAGENQIAQASAANALVRPRGRYELCVMTLETPFEVPDAELFLLNAAPARAVALDRVGLLVVNAIEAHMLSGEADVRAAHARLLALGAARAIITLGGEGAYDGEHHPAFEVPVIDTVGAGDAFVGALAASIALGKGDELQRAQAAGALACTRAGAQSGPSEEELSAFLRERSPS